jgi:hypothetical protein
LSNPSIWRFSYVLFQGLYSFLTLTFRYDFVCVCVTGVWTQNIAVAKQELYPLSHISSLFCSDYFGDGGLMNYLPRLANWDPPGLSLSSS